MGSLFLGELKEQSFQQEWTLCILAVAIVSSETKQFVSIIQKKGIIHFHLPQNTNVILIFELLVLKAALKENISGDHENTILTGVTMILLVAMTE